MPRCTAPLVVAALVLAAPAAASADVYIEVPLRFLGGPIGAPVPAVAAPGPDGVPVDGMPSRSPRGVSDPCQGEAPSDCMVWGSDADFDVPLPSAGPGGPGVVIEDEGAAPPDEEPIDGDGDDPDAASFEAGRPRAVPAAAPADDELAAAHDRLIFPRAADWLPWQRPTLRWRPTSAARYYNVQVFRGGRRVLNGWPRRAALRVPRGVLRQGRTYVWVVWPGRGRREDASFGPPVGRSSFAVTLRPRIVFRSTGSGVRAEVRPHIPGGVLRLVRPPALRRSVPARVRIGPRGRFALAVPRAAAERIGARLVGRGYAPPIGLRR